MESIKMHKYVIGWLLLMSSFAVSFPIAMMRVSQTDKFAAQPFKSLTCEGKAATNRNISFLNCSLVKTNINH